jgi:hypothetical protein
MVDVAFFGALAALSLAAAFTAAVLKILQYPARHHIPKRTINGLVDEIHQYPRKPALMGHIIDTNPWTTDPNENLTPAQTGCINCLTICPWTDTTDPPLTQELGDLWYQAHKEICPATDWPTTWDKPA